MTGVPTWSFFFVPPAKGIPWGVGPIALLPTSTKDETGAGEWGAGLTGVGLWQSPKWTIGLLASNLWSIGADEGKLFSVGRQPLNSQVAACYNVEKPEGGPDWQLRVQLQLLFPK